MLRNHKRGKLNFPWNQRKLIIINTCIELSNLWNHIGITELDPYLLQWFSTTSDFVPKGIFGAILAVRNGGGAYWPEMPLNLLQCIGQPPAIKNCRTRMSVVLRLRNHALAILWGWVYVVPMHDSYMREAKRGWITGGKWEDQIVGMQLNWGRSHCPQTPNALLFLHPYFTSQDCLEVHWFQPRVNREDAWAQRRDHNGGDFR